jgi:glycosyltransferase involved in cell wall biosynthesis
MLKEITIILPLHNKGHIIGKTIDQIFNSGLFEKCEVIVIENESTDDSLRKIEKIQKQYLTKLDIKLLKTKKGKGNAIRKAIPEIKYNLCWITGADLPFGFTDLEGAMDDKLSSDVYLGSKSHKDSKLNRKVSRRIYSWVFFWTRRIVLKLKYKDTHGSIIVKSNELQNISNSLEQDGFFIDTEIVFQLDKLGLHIVEIPVTLINDDNLTTVKPLKDGIKMLYQTLKLSIKN